LIQKLSGGVAGCRTVARRFLHETRSDTAVEFAMIGSAFFLFIFAIFVISIDQFWQMTLDDAVRNATRQVQIGKVMTDATTNGVTPGAQFVSDICNEFGAAAPDCKSTLHYSVQGGTSFSGITPATFNSNGTLTGTNVDDASFPGVTATIPLRVVPTPMDATPEFLLVQVAYPLPFKILAVPGGVATENGTSSLYSVVATAMEP
jgi:hypothetical protein